MSPMRFAMIGTIGAALTACAAGPRVEPVQVTRFHQSTALAALGSGTVFIETAPGVEASAGEIAPYKAAVAAELVRLGYREAARGDADQIAQLRIQRYADRPAQRRSPVSVGAGGSTGTYGSGVGLGIGINLGGGQREMLGTDIQVMIRDKNSGNVMWEGRAKLSVSDNSQFADSAANAAAISEALFREFPGNNGETVEVKVAN